MDITKKNILIVEDDKDAAYALGKNLEKNDYQVKVVYNGEEALKVLDEFKPRVIIADWTMPIMDGLTLLDTLREDEKHKDIYFIMLTGRGTIRDQIEGITYGADNFLVKPADPNVILAYVKAGMRITELQEELKEAEHSKALVEMAFTTGHQINNPLAGIKMSLDSIKAELNEAEIGKISEEIEIIEKSVARIQEAVKKLTNLTNPSLISYTSDTQMLNLD
jgi:DNA-binding response OmpR family regulator